MQSSQKRLAENFFFTTTVRPWMRHWPTPMILPGRKRTLTLWSWKLKSGKLFIKSLSLQSYTCWVVERQAVIDDVDRTHAKGKIPKSSNSVVAVVGTKERIWDACYKPCSNGTALERDAFCFCIWRTDCVPRWRLWAVLWCRRCKYKIDGLQRRIKIERYSCWKFKNPKKWQNRKYNPCFRSASCFHRQHVLFCFPPNTVYGKTLKVVLKGKWIINIHIKSSLVMEVLTVHAFVGNTGWRRMSRWRR